MSRDGWKQVPTVTAIGLHRVLWTLEGCVTVLGALMAAGGCQWATGLSGHDERDPKPAISSDAGSSSVSDSTSMVISSTSPESVSDGSVAESSATELTSSSDTPDLTNTSPSSAASTGKASGEGSGLDDKVTFAWTSDEEINAGIEVSAEHDGCACWIEGSASNGTGLAAWGAVESSTDWRGYGTIEFFLTIDRQAGTLWNFWVQRKREPEDSEDKAMADFVECQFAGETSENCDVGDIADCSAEGCFVRATLFEGSTSLPIESVGDISALGAFKFALYGDGLTASLCIKDIRLLP